MGKTRQRLSNHFGGFAEVMSKSTMEKRKGAMRMRFEVNEVLPGVMHIRDEMGVCMTLLTGDQAALLVDTGYGTQDVSAFVSTLTKLPVTVLLTHHHHDHALGVRWFDKSVMFAEDLSTWSVYTGENKRHVVFGQAKAKNLPVVEDEFMHGACQVPYGLREGKIELGGMTAIVMRCPGHTPGSACILIPERKLLLTADNWNPCTWVFFPEALGIQTYRNTVRKLQKLDFDYVLCSHQHALYSRSRFDDFVNHLTDEVLLSAFPVKIGGYEHIDTRQANVTDGQILVFDWGKAELDEQERI